MKWLCPPLPDRRWRCRQSGQLVSLALFLYVNTSGSPHRGDASVFRQFYNKLFSATQDQLTYLWTFCGGSTGSVDLKPNMDIPNPPEGEQDRTAEAVFDFH